MEPRTIEGNRLAVSFIKPRKGPVNVRHNFECPTCGTARQVFYQGINPGLPLGGAWHGPVPCPGCLDELRYRLTENGANYILEIVL